MINNNDFKTINYKVNFKRSKIKPKNIFNNNKLFAYQKASGNFVLLKKLIHQTFIDKYYHDKNFYNSKVIQDIINNESTHVVAEFKDYLIYGDDSEFLQKIYNIKESKKYLPKIFNYYESCSVIFPNYVVLHESKYIYKNIQKKQKVIDIQQEQEDKLEKMKSGLNNEKDKGGGKDSLYSLFNTKAMNSILGQTNTSNINKIFGISNKKNDEKEQENSDYLINNIIDEFEKIDEKKTFQKKKINLIKKKSRSPSLNLNNNQGLINQNNNQKEEKENNDKEKKANNYKKKTFIITNKQNNNKNSHLKKKSLSKRNENEKTNLIFNNSKKEKNKLKENKNFLTHDNTSHKNYSKIPKSKLNILEGVKRHVKIKSIINEKDILYNQKGISFFNDILRKKILKKNNSKSNISAGKSSSKINSFIPSQKQLFKKMKNDKYINEYKSKKNKNEKTSQINYSTPSLAKEEQEIKKENISKTKVPIINIRDSNSSNNILNNYLTSSHSRSIIKKRILKKENAYYLENNNNNDNKRNNKEITSESNINININTLPLTDREKSGKKIYFTIIPHINNMINLNKIKYMMRTSSRENFANSCNNEGKIVKNSQIYKNIKKAINKKINKFEQNKNINNNKHLSIYKTKNKSNNIKISYKYSNTQISSSVGTAACSFRKNSYLKDFETININQKKSNPYKNLFKANNKKKKFFDNSNRKFSLSPDKILSKELVKKMLLNNNIPKNNYSKNIFNNKLNSKKASPLYDNNKKQKNAVLPIRKEKDLYDIKIKEMMNLILSNKVKSNISGNISRNAKSKNSYKDKNIITISNKTNNSINTNESIKMPMLSLKTSKNFNSSNKIKNKYIYLNNKTYNKYIKSNK